MKLKVFIVFVFSFFVIVGNAYGQEQEYVLPYPGFMPGNPFYKISLFLDKVEQWWSFGNLSHYKYYLKISDKKLIEAKTLFEYKQYLLALDALHQSDAAFDNAKLSLTLAKENKEDISKKEIEFKQAAVKHKKVLQDLLSVVPNEFLWQPEKTLATNLKIKDEIESAIKKRE